MTSIVGVYCNDGVVIGTDSSVTFGDGRNQTIEQPREKLKVIGDLVIVAGTGQVGLGQRFTSIVQDAYDSKTFNRNTTGLDVSRHLCRNAIGDFTNTGLKTIPYGALVAFPTGSRFHLCEFAINDFQPEMKNEDTWYVSMGSAQHITDPFLAFIREVFWENGIPSVNDAEFAVTWTLDQAVAYNPGGVNGPVRIAVLDRSSGKSKARILEDEVLYEHRENIDECKHVLRELQDKHQLSDGPAPAVPKI